MLQKILNIVKKNAVGLFLFKMFIFGLIVYLLDFTAGSILRYYYFKQDSGLQYRTTYAVDSTRADFLVFGSSRANHHYEPEIFESRLQMPYYNIGRDGSYIFYHYAILQSVLKRYTPKVIILDVILGEFKTGEESYDRLSALLPYYKSHPEMRPTINMKSEHEKLKLISNIYPFNSSLFTIAVGNTKYNKTRMNDIKGYVPLFNKWEHPISRLNELPYPLDTVKINMYSSFLKDCIRRNIKLYVVCSPYFLEMAGADLSIAQAKMIAQQLQLPFLDYSKDSYFLQHPELFSDVDHLNNEGAIVFSNKIVDDISGKND